MVNRVCMQCGKEFATQNSTIKRGGGKFCSVSCSTTYRNLHDNPSKRDEVRKKISKNHADVSGENNPMYGRRGKDAPSYVDGRSKFKGEIYSRILQANNVTKECKICKSTENLNVHHKDGNHKNNAIDNLEYLCTKCHLTKAHKYNRDGLGRFTSSELRKEVIL